MVTAHIVECLHDGRSITAVVGNICRPYLNIICDGYRHAVQADVKKACIGMWHERISGGRKEAIVRQEMSPSA